MPTTASLCIQPDTLTCLWRRLKWRRGKGQQPQLEESSRSLPRTRSSWSLDSGHRARRSGSRDLAAGARSGKGFEQPQPVPDVPAAHAAGDGRANSARRAGRALNLYAESSAVVAWLLNEPGSEVVQIALGTADSVAASHLTLVECDRALIRAEALLGEPETNRRRDVFHATSASWTLAALGPDVIDRARRPFPVEPIRTRRLASRQRSEHRRRSR